MDRISNMFQFKKSCHTNLCFHENMISLIQIVKQIQDAVTIILKRAWHHLHQPHHHHNHYHHYHHNHLNAGELDHHLADLPLACNPSLHRHRCQGERLPWHLQTGHCCSGWKRLGSCSRYSPGGCPHLHKNKFPHKPIKSCLFQLCIGAKLRKVTDKVRTDNEL